MALPRVKVTNLEAWGNLVKTWATGQDRIGNGGTYLPPPTTVDELKTQCGSAGVGLTVPANFTSLTIIQGDENSILIKLPPRAMVLDSENELNGGATYQLPAFYSPDVFNNAPELVTNKMKVHAERIGDYTLSICQ
jgi:hypothetical protein